MSRPAASSSLYARATVPAATPSSAARLRTEGSRCPAANVPTAMSEATWLRICSYGGVGAARSTRIWVLMACGPGGQRTGRGAGQGWLERRQGLWKGAEWGGRYG